MAISPGGQEGRSAEASHAGHFNAKLYYLDKQSRWQELANKPVEWFIDNQAMDRVTTDDRGRAPYTRVISNSARIGTHYARVYFRGDLKYKNSYSRRVSFRVVP